jgi:predicted TIM-barrel fold metal-dependent hydrolase
MEYRLISADDHIDLRYLPRTLWTERVPAALRDRAPRVLDADEGPVWVCGDTVWGPWGRGGGLKWALDREGDPSLADAPRPTTPHLRLADMDRDGIDASVMYGPVAPLRVEDAALRQACYAAYNDWLAEFCQVAPQRLLGVAILPADDPALATAELTRIAANGLRHAVLLAAAARPPLYHPAWEPFWAAAAETEVPIGMHLLVAPPAVHPGVMPLAAAAINGVQVPLQLLDPLVGLIFSGVLDRHPGVRLVLAESGIGWLPYALQRMDNEYRKLAEVRAHWEARGGFPLQLRPSEYFRRQVWATFQDDAVGLALLDTIGEDRVMWASDYPHPDSTWPHSRAVIARQMGHLPAATVRRLTCDNARTLYRLGTEVRPNPLGVPQA